MKASKLIKKLQEAVDKHGDLPVRFFENMRDKYVGSIQVYDENGNFPDEFNLPCEIYLHSKTGANK